MTTKIYRTARGKQVDIGSLRLQNEHVRAVGNMGVNARGDRIDSQGNVIDPINKQTQRRINKQTNVSGGPVHSSSKAIQRTVVNPDIEEDPLGPLDSIDQPDLIQPDPVQPAIVPTTVPQEEPAKGGLAAAIARSQTVKQELEKAPNTKPQNLRKI